MSNILRIYKAVPYTPQALKLLENGWKIPDGLDVPCFAESSQQNLFARLEQTKDALRRVETLIGTANSDAEQIVLQNVVRLPIIQLRQQLTQEALMNMPRIVVSYSEVQQIMEEILYESIRQKTGNHHVPVNNINGYKDEVKLVSACLADAEGQGHETHGVSRILDYATAILEDKINTQGRVELIKKTYGKLSFTGGGTFGQVAAQIALQGGFEYMHDLPEGSLLTVTMRHAYHAGRLEWIERQAVRNGFACLALFNVGGKGRTAPEDGMEPRWGTNPMAFGVATGIGEDGFVGDIATTARPEGWVQVAHLNDLIVPLDVLRTPEGHPTIEPGGVYRKDGRPDLLLPVGGEVAAYKGAVVGEGIELLIDAVSEREPGEITPQKNNNLVLFLCKGSRDIFAAIREKLADIESCPTASGNPIRRPGAEGLQKLGRAKIDGLSIAKGTWEKILILHQELCRKV